MTRNPAEASDTAWKEHLKKCLVQSFGYANFRNDLQELAVETVFRDKVDVFVIMPTGAGKSLCYQLPAIADDRRVTVVVSPLIALITDQVAQMKKLNIRAETLNSSLPKWQQDVIKNELESQNCQIKLLYVTPELCATPNFRELLKSLSLRKQLARLAIDEAHCVSQWGHDFRPSYLKLGELRHELNAVPFVALTATASEKVVQDTIKLLCLHEPCMFRSSPFRKNLFYEVAFKDILDDPLIDLKEFALSALDESVEPRSCPGFVKASGFLEAEARKDSKGKGKLAPRNQSLITNFLNGKNGTSKPTTAFQQGMSGNQEFATGCGIVYCRSRNGCDDLAAGLTQKGLLTKAYHAGLTAKQRDEVQKSWTSGKVPCICATISFGMGVDKANVRFVAHWNLPHSIIRYYQESGRAGRDGKPAKCRIYYSKDDVKCCAYILQEELKTVESSSKKAQQSRNALKEFDKVVTYCEKAQCRHLSLCKEFDPKATFDGKQSCSECCDICVFPDRVKKQLEMLKSFSTPPKRASYASEGFGLEKYMYDDSEKDHYSSKGDDPEFKMLSVVQKEFAKRKRSCEPVRQSKALKTMSDCDAGAVLEPQNTRISGIDIKTRSLYLNKIFEDMEKHLNEINEGKAISDKTKRKISAKIELDHFKKSSTKNSYKLGIMKITKEFSCTKDKIHDVVESFLESNA